MRCRYPLAMPLVLLLIPIAALPAQRAPSSRAVRRATETITAADIRRRMAVLADDSMRGRDTPSPELEKAARHIAAEFRRLGLRPGGDDGGFLQRYTIRCAQPDTVSAITLRLGDRTVRWRLGRELGLLTGAVLDRTWTGPVVLFTGLPPDTGDLFGGVELRDALVVHAARVDLMPRLAEVLPHIVGASRRGIAAWLVVTEAPPADFGRVLARTLLRPSCGVAGGTAVDVRVLAGRDSTARAILGAAGVDLAATLAGPAGVVRTIPGLAATLRTARRNTSATSAPNVVGILEGSDPVLSAEHVVVTAHFDHIGVGRPVGGDSIFNGADDNASGTAAVLEIAEAFAGLQPRPRRSLIFLAVSGEDKGMWGSAWYAAHPTVPLERTVANLNLDMISRGWRDSVAVVGLDLSSLGETIRRVAREHPEAGTVPVGDHWPEVNHLYRSDHISFAQRGVPILCFIDGGLRDYHRVTDQLDRADTEAAARIARLTFLTALEVANGAERPTWDEAARARVVR